MIWTLNENSLDFQWNLLTKRRAIYLERHFFMCASIAGLIFQDK